MFGLCAECCALLSLGNESIQHKHWTTGIKLICRPPLQKWFLITCHRPPCPSTEQHAWREPFPTLWEVGYSHHSLAALPPALSGSVILFQSFYQPSPLLHLSSSLININTTCSRTTWEFQACQDDRHECKALWKNRLGESPNSPSLSIDLEKKMYSFVLLCKRCQVYFGMHFKSYLKSPKYQAAQWYLHFFFLRFYYQQPQWVR